MYTHPLYEGNSIDKINFIKNDNQLTKTAIIPNDYKIYCLLIAYFNFFFFRLHFVCVYTAKRVSVILYYLPTPT